MTSTVQRTKTERWRRGIPLLNPQLPACVKREALGKLVSYSCDEGKGMRNHLIDWVCATEQF
jgi:hypothetical protein